MGSFSPLSAAAVGIPSAIIGAVVGYLLSERAHKRRKIENRREELSQTAEALLKELLQIEQVLKKSYPQFVGSTEYWTPFPRLPEAMYLELDGQGRIVRLGVSIASDVHALYADVERISQLLSGIEQTISDHPEVARNVDFLNANVGDQWQQIWICRTRIEQRLEVLRPQLATCGPVRARS